MGGQNEVRGSEALRSSTGTSKGAPP